MSRLLFSRLRKLDNPFPVDHCSPASSSPRQVLGGEIIVSEQSVIRLLDDEGGGDSRSIVGVVVGA
jgi:hypothetical protein